MNQNAEMDNQYFEGKTPARFPLFPELPTEVRLLIWEAALKNCPPNIARMISTGPGGFLLQVNSDLASQ